MRALGKTMRDYGYNWCQMCEVFARHSPNASPVTQQDRWALCAANPIDDFIPVDRPEGSLRIEASSCQACPAGWISDASGVCQQCPSGQRVVGNTCQPCAPGEIIATDGTCQACGPRDIVASNACVTCPFDQGPNPARDTCLACLMDLVIDWQSVPAACTEAIELTETHVPGDVCPDRFWVRLTGLQDTLAAAYLSQGLFMSPVTSLTGAACSQSMNTRIVADPSAAGLTQISSSSASGVPPSTGDGGVVPNPDCSYGAFVQLASAAELQAGLDTRVFATWTTSQGAQVPTRVNVVNQGFDPSCNPE